MTPAPHRPATAPFRIEKAGLYLTRDGRTVEVTRRLRSFVIRDPKHPWLANYPHGGVMYHRDDGTSHAISYAGANYDIIARAPVAPKPAPASKVRRYVVRRQYWPQTSWMVCDATVTDSDGDIAQGMTRADARAFAAMKNATTPTTSNSK